MQKEIEKLYQLHKPLLFSLAYRMLGSVMDAEDIVHETMIAYARAEGSTPIEHARAYLCKIATNLCLNRLRSAQHQRETYFGQWLPEPIDTSESVYDPDHEWSQKESLSMAYLLLLDRLNYTERAVFLLRESFGLDYDFIAEAVEKTSLNCRQIYRRAKSKMSKMMTKGEASVLQDNTAMSGGKNYMRILERFIEALVNGDIQATLSLLSEQAIMISDGGGKAKVAPRPIFGKENVAKFLFGILSEVQRKYTTRVGEINGLPGLILTDAEGASHVISFHYSDGTVEGIYYMANPEKLRHFDQKDDRNVRFSDVPSSSNDAMN